MEGIVNPKEFINNDSEFADKHEFLALLPAVMTILVSASLFFFVPTNWAALPVAAAVMLGVAIPSATWIRLGVLSNIFSVLEIRNNASIIAAMAITIAIGIAAAVLSALFLPSFAPLLAGIILSALAIVPASFVNLLWATAGICKIVSTTILKGQNAQIVAAMCSLWVSILLAIAFAVPLLVFCSAQTAMLAIFAVGGGCVASFAIFFVFHIIYLCREKNE
ncbi:MAG: hypothetical protein LBG86_00820 [Puniceicoccales bacterium]|jgi:hypothetical protein|nr:hypothetical protein [Puniceicoccales bacterium]